MIRPTMPWRDSRSTGWEATGEQSGGGEPPLEQIEGYLVIADAEDLRRVTPEQIRDKLGELGLETAIEIRPVTDLGAFKSIQGSEREPDPMPVKRADFVTFARDHGYSDMCAWLAWNATISTGDPDHIRRLPSYFHNRLPAIRLLIEGEYGHSKRFGGYAQDQPLALEPIKWAPLKQGPYFSTSRTASDSMLPRLTSLLM